MTDTLRIGQIGIAHTHASKLVDAPSPAVLQRLNTELVGIHEPDAAMFAERRARDTWIDNPQQIFDDDSISIVFIETWPWDCLEWGRRALNAGKHILDKPPGASVEALRELYDIAAAAGLCIQMGYQWRFSPGLELSIRSPGCSAKRIASIPF